MQYGPNEIEEKKTNPFLKFLCYFWGPIPWMIEVAVVLSGGPALARFLHHSAVVLRQRDRRLLGRTPGGQRHRCAEGEAGDQGPGETRRQVGHAAGAGTGAGRRHTPAPGRHRAGRCAVAGRRRNIRGSVGADRGIFADHAQIRRRDLLRLDRSSRRDRRAGLCDGRQNLFWQDGGTGGDGGHRQPFSESRSEDRQLPDHAGGGHGGADHRTWRSIAASRSSPRCSSPSC